MHDVTASGLVGDNLRTIPKCLRTAASLTSRGWIETSLSLLFGMIVSVPTMRGTWSVVGKTDDNIERRSDHTMKGFNLAGHDVTHLVVQDRQKFMCAS